MRDFLAIVAAALASAAAGGAFGAALGWFSPEFVRLAMPLRPVDDSVRVAGALGAVAGLFLGAATMAFGLLIGALRAATQARGGKP